MKICLDKVLGACNDCSGRINVEGEGYYEFMVTGNWFITCSHCSGLVEI